MSWLAKAWYILFLAIVVMTFIYIISYSAVYCGYGGSLLAVDFYRSYLGSDVAREEDIKFVAYFVSSAVGVAGVILLLRILAYGLVIQIGLCVQAYLESFSKDTRKQ